MALLKNKTPIKELLKNQNVQRMLKTIRYAEGTDNERGYNTRVGYQYFNDLSKKPGKSVYIKSIGQSSSAEGAYQFLNGTWDDVSKSLGLKDFSKESQDLAAIELIRRIGALDDVLNNDFENAVNKLSPVWASLPKSDGEGYYRGQKARSMSKLRKVYDGKITPEITNYTETEKRSTFVPILESSVNESKLYSVDITKADKEKTEITEQEQKVEAELDNAKREEDFLNEYFSQQEVAQFEQPVQQIQESPAPNIMQDFTQIEQFVDNPLMQQGGEKDDEWLKNWYSNRVIPNKDIQNAYLEDKDIYVNRMNSENYPPAKNVDIIEKNEPRITGRYDSNKNEILLTPNSTKNTYLHELTHYSDNFPSVMRTVHGNITKQNIAPKEAVNSQPHKDKYDYFSDPDEVHARVMVFRKTAGIKPDQVVTPEFLDKFLKDYKGDEENINDLLNISDKPHLLEMLNYMADNSKLDKNSNVAQQGGQEIIDDNMGQYNHPGKVTRISSPFITMKDVPYDILAIANNGEKRILKPNEEHYFKGAKTVTEYPILTENEKAFLQAVNKLKKQWIKS